MVEGTLIIHNYRVNVLIDPSSSYSHINEDCTYHLGWDSLDLPYTLMVSTPLGNSIETGKYIPACVVRVEKEELLGDLIVTPFEDYDLILGMDWLSEHNARVNCKEMLVQFVRPEKDVLEVKGSRVKELKYLISRVKAQNSIKKGC
jgi:hypothetical protein